MRHLHDKVKMLEERTAPAKEDPVQEAHVAAAATMMGAGMINDRLLLGDGSGYGKFLTIMMHLGDLVYWHRCICSWSKQHSGPLCSSS